MKPIALTVAALAAAALAPTASAVPSVVNVVLKPGDLPGWAPTKPVVRQGPVAFGAAHEKTPAALRRRGFVAGATGELAGPKRGFGLSIVTRYSNDAAAAAEAARLARANVGPDGGLSATPLTVPGVSGATAVVLRGSRNGVDLVGASAVVARGRFVIELFVIGTGGAAPPAKVAVAIRRCWTRAAVG